MFIGYFSSRSSFRDVKKLDENNSGGTGRTLNVHVVNRLLFCMTSLVQRNVSEKKYKT